MKKIKIYCKACNVKLTDELEEIGEDTLQIIDGKHLIEYDKFSFHTENQIRNLVVAIEPYFLKNHTDYKRFTVVAEVLDGSE